MRGRTIKPGFFKNEDLAACSPHARLLFAGLWCAADREGRLEDRPARIRAEVFPYEMVDANALLDELASRGFITRYAVGERNYLQINTFAAHQKPHPREAASSIPDLNEARQDLGHAKALPRREKALPSPAGSSGSSGSSGPSGSSGSSGPSEKNSCAEPAADASAHAPSVASPVAFVLPCVGKGPREYGITKADIAEWTDAYPGVDVPTEIKRAVQWARDNPTRRKTHTGARSFLSRWLARAQDSGRQAREGPALAHRKAGWNPHHAQQMDELMAGAERVGFEEDEG